METPLELFYKYPNKDPYTNLPIVINSSDYFNLVSQYGYPKIISPISGYKISVGKSQYNKLISSGYNEKELLSSSSVQKIKSPKTGSLINKNGATYKQLISLGYFNNQNPTLPDEIILNELLMIVGLNEFIIFCQINKKYKEICQNELFWKNLYDRYYGDSNMDKLKKSYFEQFKLCYQLTILIKTLSLKYNLYNLYQSKSLYLNDNQLTTIPPEFGQLTQLQILYLHHNQLTTIPPELGQLTQLQYLYLGDNQLTTIPIQILNYKNIKIYLR